MRGWFGPLVALAITGLVAHFAVLIAAPGVIMNTALDTLEGRGIAQHAFTTGVRITPQTQAVVRTSPDLFYSLCRYDLSEAGSALDVTMAEWPGYQSLSFFDANTNNFVTLRGEGERVDVRLTGPNSLGASSTVTSPTERGVVLIRRLAPSQELFDQAQQLSADDGCVLVSDTSEGSAETLSQ